MKSIIYKSFLPKQETPKSEETHISPPSGIYRPQYNWKDPEQEDDTLQQETQQSQETVVSPENTPTWTNPSGTIIISDTNDPIYRTPVTTSRVQHQFKSSDIQVGEMQELLDRFADAGISLRITSGYRPGATTSSGNQSWHASGYALDITPIAGQTYETFKQQLRNNPELVKWMQDNGFGIIDETTPEMQSRTGATGAHWHIGKDKLAQSGLQAILSARNGAKLPIITASSGRKLDKQQARVTSRLYEMADHKHKQQHPLTARTDKPLEPVSIASILPGTGDVAEGASIVDNVLNKNIIQALISVGLFALPGNFSKVTKTLGFNYPHTNNWDFVKIPHKNKGIDYEIKEIPSLFASRYNNGGAKRIGTPETYNGEKVSDIIQNWEPSIIETFDDLGNRSRTQVAFYNPHGDKELAIFDKNTTVKEATSENKYEALNETLSDINRRSALDHEISHWLDETFRPEFMNSNIDFLTHSAEKQISSPTEIAARVGQVKDYAKITDGSKVFTGDEYKTLFENYLKNPKNPDNYIKLLHDRIKNWNKFAEWANKNVNIISKTTRPILINNKNNEDEE